MTETVELRERADEPLLDAFYAGIYLDAFAHQAEPLAVWKRRLWHDASPPYHLTIRIAGTDLRDPEHRAIHGGIVHELYPRSRCGFVTYLVVAPAHRGTGLGRRLLRESVEMLRAATDGHAYVLGEVSDPTKQTDPAKAREARERIARFERWGARLVDAPYIQPSLGPGLPRDRALRLAMFTADTPLPDTISGERLAAFLDELFTVTEGAPPTDAEFAELRHALQRPVSLAVSRSL